MSSIIIFGASKLGEVAYTFLKEKYHIVCFCDNDINKQGTTFLSKEVILPDELLSMEGNFQIVIASSYVEEISNQLENMGFYNYLVFNAGLGNNASWDSLLKNRICNVLI